jgi:hypothetical protein
VNRAALGLIAGFTLLSLWTVSLAGTLGTDSGGGSSVLLNENVFVQGGSAATTELYAPQVGVLSVTLTDEAFPSTFTNLQFGLGAGKAAVGAMSNAGTLTLDLTAPSEVYANVFWTTQNGFGLYNLTADFQPGSAVPLPASGSSLAGGFLLMLVLWLAADRLVPKATDVGADETVTSAVV